MLNLITSFIHSNKHVVIYINWQLPQQFMFITADILFLDQSVKWNVSWYYLESSNDIRQKSPLQLVLV